MKRPMAKMEPNAMPSLRLVDKPCWAVLTLCVMLRSGTLEGWDYVSDSFVWMEDEKD